MYTLTFLVCNTITGMCYSAASGSVYLDKKTCEMDAVAIIDRNIELQKLGERAKEKAVFVCYNWGEQAWLKD